MWRNFLTLVIGLAISALLFAWLAPYVLSGRIDTLPDYGELVSYDPMRPGGQFKPKQDLLVSSDRYGHGVRWITNSEGFRNDHEITQWPQEGTLRILFYGDSFVGGIRTDQSDTMGAVLERELARRLRQPVEVVISSHNNPANEWYNWQTFGHKLHPHFVIIGLTVGNDISSHNFGAGVLPVLSSMDELVSLDPSFGQAGVDDPDVMIPADGFLPEEQWSQPAIWSARLTRILGHLTYPLANRVTPALWPEQGQPGKARAAGFFLSLGMYYRGSIAYIESMWRDFDTLLPGFVAQIRHRGARPVMVMFPTRIEALPRDWSRLVDALQLDREQFDLHAPARHLQALCDSIALPCLNTSAALQAAQQEDEVFMSLGDMHFSAHGQEAVALAIADFIELQLQQPPAPPPDANWLDGYRVKIQQWAARRPPG